MNKPLYQINKLLVITSLFALIACQENKKHNSISYSIAYTSLPSGTATIYKRNAKGESNTESTNMNGGYLAWSPDGKKLAFYHKYDDKKTWSIHTMNVDGTNWKRLTHAKNKWDYGPDWSPDGKKIVFAREYKDSTGIAHPEIWIMNADGSEQTQIKPLRGGSPFFTPDGNRIVFSAEYQDKKTEICIADIDGSNIVQLTANNADDWHPDVSSDGKQITFMSDRDGNFEIYVMNIDGSNQKRLTNDSADNWYPSWSPDGSKLIYSIKTGKERKDRDIFIMNKDGSSVEKIISNGAQAAWLK